MSDKYLLGPLLNGVWCPSGIPPCSVNPDGWADDGVYTKDPIIKAEAIATCVFACPYRADCLAAALKEEGSKESHRRHGIRGGLLPKDRYRIYKRKKLCENLGKE